MVEGGGNPAVDAVILYTVLGFRQTDSAATTKETAVTLL